VGDSVVFGRVECATEDAARRRRLFDPRVPFVSSEAQQVAAVCLPGLRRAPQAQ